VTVGRSLQRTLVPDMQGRSTQANLPEGYSGLLETGVRKRVSLRSPVRENRAPRDAVLNPWCNQERLGGRPLGHPTHRMSKDSRDNSLLEKRETSEDAEGVVWQDPYDRVKAGLPDPYSPAVQPHTHSHSVLWLCHRERPSRFGETYPPPAGRLVANQFKERNGAPPSYSRRAAPDGTRDDLQGARLRGTECQSSSWE